jgi:hypothetical protein
MNKYKLIHDNNIDENSKLIIGIGDSFCAGAGSESIETWERNNWDVEKVRRDSIGIEESYENSFINLLSKKYLNDYIPINLGMSGKGNRFSVRELFLHPTLNLEKAKEKIVIFVVSGFDRLDVVNNIVESYNHSTTLWPIYLNDKTRTGYAKLTRDDGVSIYDEKFVVSELILDFFTLLNWCELNNAKLLFISGFTPELNMNHFLRWLTETPTMDFDKTLSSKFVSKIPWHRQIKPMGFDCITSMLVHLEGRDDLIPNYGFKNFKPDTITEKGYMSKCQHPTQKGHDLLCDIVYEHIKNYDNVEIPNLEKMCMDYYQQKYDEHQSHLKINGII